MLNEQESQDLIVKLLELRKVNSPELKKHEQLCMEKFKYLIAMHTSRYKQFNNYDDLNQEGFVALLKSIKTYNPDKGSFFYWAHKYVNTCISRSANQHTVIRYPLTVAKNQAPRRESIMPHLMDESTRPDKQFEIAEINNLVNNASNELSIEQKNIISLIFGLDSGKSMSISKVCKKCNITRTHCIHIVKRALSIIKSHV
jgi:RNA polymerase sigma factor (sigma-70 family)